jgi:hypothetical protein
MKMKVGMIALLSILSLKLFANSDAICGVWMDDNKEGKTLFYKVSPDKYEAKLVWLKDSVDSKGQPLWILEILTRRNVLRRVSD